LKVSTVRQDLTSDGSEFQVCGAATEKYRHAGQVTTGFSTGKKLSHTALSGWKQPHQAYNPVGIHQMAPQ